MKLHITVVFVVVVGLTAVGSCHCSQDSEDWDLWAYQKLNHFLVVKLPTMDMCDEEFVGEELDLNLSAIRAFKEDEEAKVSPDGKLVMATSAIVALADMKGHQLCEYHSLELLKDISGSIGDTEDGDTVDRIRRIVQLFLRTYKNTCMPAAPPKSLMSKFDFKFQEKLKKLKKLKL